MTDAPSLWIMLAGTAGGLALIFALGAAGWLFVAVEKLDQSGAAERSAR
jgi:hypothetical protein